MKNSVYQNKYFGFTIKFPAGWSVQDQEAQRRLTQAGIKIVAGDDKNMKATIKTAEMQSVNLFAVFKSPLGSPVPFNPSIMSIAEKVKDFPGIKQGKDYLFQARQMLESGQLEVSFPKEIYTEQLGGVDFDVMELDLTIRGITVTQKYFATISKGYALTFIASFTNEDEEAFQRKTLDTIVFAK